MKDTSEKELKAPSNLQQRVSTGTVFVIAMLAGVFGGGYTFLLLFLVIDVFCLREFLGMLLPHEKKRDQIRLIIGVLAGTLPFLISAISELRLIDFHTYGFEINLLILPILLMIFIFELFGESPKPFENIGTILTGMVYIGFPMAFLPFIAFEEGQYASRFIISLLLIVWLNDTGAYFVGKRHGKNPLFQRISPAKTWEGLLGGILVAIMLAAILSIFIPDLNLYQWILLTTVTVTFGNLGDLVESMLKRSLAIKDSGSILPGHGGFLDRFDGFIFSIPFYAITLYWMLQ